MAKKAEEGGYTCECGKFNKFPAYVYAHWNDVIVHICSCARRYEIQNGCEVLMNRRATKAQVKELYPNG